MPDPQMSVRKIQESLPIERRDGVRAVVVQIAQRAIDYRNIECRHFGCAEIGLAEQPPYGAGGNRGQELSAGIGPWIAAPGTDQHRTRRAQRKQEMPLV